MATSGENGWGLEVVRGREAGRVFALDRGRSVLGNALGGEAGVDLGDQEGASPRRMAGKQATVDCSAEGLTLRDLDSPGGTFVNRQRLLPGQARRLEAGDLIQLAGLQLRIVARTAKRPKETVPTALPPPAAKAGGLPAPFLLATGAVCRNWDDFLTVSAQNWGALRDELSTGRLARFLQSIGRDDLRPASGSSKPPDDCLDDWLGRLPTTRAAEPDLEVHPTLVRVRALPGGGLTRPKVVVTSTGYRLLRSTLRVEPVGISWLRVAPPFADGPFTTAESTEIPLEVQVPESLDAPRSGFLTVVSNGGTRRVEVRVEPPAAPDPPLEAVGVDRDGSGPDLRGALAGLSSRTRVVFGALGALFLRILVALGDQVPGLAADGASRPSLEGVAVLLGVVGGVVGAWCAGRRGEARDVPPAAFAGAVGGLLTAATVVAVCRSFEPFAGRGFVLSVLSGCLLWAALGALAGEGSRWFVPHEPRNGDSP